MLFNKVEISIASEISAIIGH